MGTDVTHLGAWRKASRSGNNGGDCIQTAVIWRKAARSGNNGGSCVETAALDRAVAVRDSKDPDGGQLRVSKAAWKVFARRVREDG